MKHQYNLEKDKPDSRDLYLQVPRPHYYTQRPPSPYVKKNSITVVNYESVMIPRSPSPYYELKESNKFLNWFYNIIQFFK